MHKNYSGKVSGPYTAEEAVMHQGQYEANTREGQIERLQAQVESLQCTVGRLIDVLPSTSQAAVQDLLTVLGYNWEAEK